MSDDDVIQAIRTLQRHGYGVNSKRAELIFVATQIAQSLASNTTINVSRTATGQIGRRASREAIDLIDCIDKHMEAMAQCENPASSA